MLSEGKPQTAKKAWNIARKLLLNRLTNKTPHD